MKNSETNGRAAAKAARWWNIAANVARERKRTHPRFFEEFCRRFVNYARRPAFLSAFDSDETVKAQGHAQTIETRTKVRSAGRDLNCDFCHRSKDCKLNVVKR